MAEYDASLRGETARIAKELRDNLFGREVWGALEISSRNFLASGEAIFRSRKDDPRFDFSSVVMEYAKAIKVELNVLLWRRFRVCLGDLPPKDTVTQLHNRAAKTDLKSCSEHLSLNVLLANIKNNKEVKACVEYAFSNPGWLLHRMPKRLRELTDLRNPSVHKIELSRERVDEIRNGLLGIGCQGLLSEMVERKMGRD